MSLPIDLQPAFGPALVVGGGHVAARKVRGLLEAGFEVTVVSPQVLSGIAGPGVTIVHREFELADVDGHAIVFACTNDRTVNHAVGRAAQGAGRPVLVADSQRESTFFTPAVHRDGELTIAVSTGGASPRMAAALRDRLGAAVGEGWTEKVEAARVGRRPRLATGGGSP